MKLLKPGTGNQSANKKAATEYITKNIFVATIVDEKSGKITTADGDSFQVSAYAETPAAFVSTPKNNKSPHSIYASGLRALMFRQLKHDDRSFIYEVEPTDIVKKPNSSSAEWIQVEKAATRIWICTDEQVHVIEKTK